MNDEQAAGQCSPSDPLKPDDSSSGVLLLGPRVSSAKPSGCSANSPKGEGESGPVFFLTALPVRLMPYLNLDPDFFGHPKCIKLVSLLGDRAEVYPMRLWCHAAKYHPKDGNFSGYSDQALSKIAGWEGNPNDLLQPLIETGFLDKTPNGYVLHDWQDHEGHLEMLKDRARKGAKARWSRLKTRGTKAMLKQSSCKTPPGKERIGKERSLSSTTGKEIVKRETPHQTIINRYLELSGIARDTLTREQVTGAYKRHSRSALALISEAGGLDHALNALEVSAAYFTKKALTWTLDTVAKHLPKLEGYRHELLAQRNGLTRHQLDQLSQLASWYRTKTQPGAPDAQSRLAAQDLPHVPA